MSILSRFVITMKGNPPSLPPSLPASQSNRIARILAFKCRCLLLPSLPPSLPLPSVTQSNRIARILAFKCRCLLLPSLPPSLPPSLQLTVRDPIQ